MTMVLAQALPIIEPRVPANGRPRTRRPADAWPSDRSAARVSREAGALLGKRTRAELPRDSHGEWAPPADRSDPVQLLVDMAVDRLSDLLPERNRRMLESPFTFYRGSAALMAAD